MRLQNVREEIHTFGRTQASHAYSRRRAQFPVFDLQETLFALGSSQQTLTHTRQIANGNQSNAHRA